MRQITIEIDQATYSMLEDTAQKMGTTVEEIAAIVLHEQRQAIEQMGNPIFQRLMLRLKQPSPQRDRLIASAIELVRAQ